MVDTYTFSPVNLTVAPSLTVTTIVGNDNTFPTDLPNPSFGLTENLGYRFLGAAFGDGYSQRTGDGLNTEQSSYDPTWNHLTQEQYDTLRAYLSTRKGYRAFLWQAPNRAEAEPFICKSFSVQMISYRHYSISAKFERVYDLL